MSFTDLPKNDEPLNCAFQRRDKGSEKIECAVTEVGTFYLLFSAVERDKCMIDMCPMYQNWQLNKKILSKLELEK